MSTEPQSTDARIRDAAPDLLAAAEAVLDVHSRNAIFGQCDAWELLFNAIAKAKGMTPNDYSDHRWAERQKRRQAWYERGKAELLAAFAAENDTRREVTP